MMNPTNEAFEKRIAAVEGGNAALSVSSGMAAITLGPVKYHPGRRRNSISQQPLRGNLPVI